MPCLSNFIMTSRRHTILLCITRDIISGSVQIPEIEDILRSNLRRVLHLRTLRAYISLSPKEQSPSCRLRAIVSATPSPTPLTPPSRTSWPTTTAMIVSVRADRPIVRLSVITNNSEAVDIALTSHFRSPRCGRSQREGNHQRSNQELPSQRFLRTRQSPYFLLPVWLAYCS